MLGGYLAKKHVMSVREEEIKCWTVRRKSAPVLTIIESNSMISEAGRQCDLASSEIDG